MNRTDYLTLLSSHSVPDTALFNHSHPIRAALCPYFQDEKNRGYGSLSSQVKNWQRGDVHTVGVGVEEVGQVRLQRFAISVTLCSPPPHSLKKIEC